MRIFITQNKTKSSRYLSPLISHLSCLFSRLASRVSHAPEPAHRVAQKGERRVHARARSADRYLPKKNQTGERVEKNQTEKNRLTSRPPRRGTATLSARFAPAARVQTWDLAKKGSRLNHTGNPNSCHTGNPRLLIRPARTRAPTRSCSARRARRARRGDPPRLNAHTREETD